jgi:uncharacterized membrane protein YphA (DoxX/SURF4 family)
MDVALWITSAVLSLAFLGAGFTKLRDDRLTYAATRPPATSFAEDLSNPVFKTIGVLEILGATGVLLPWGLDVAPILTPLAAAGLAVVMVAAIAVHLRRGERQPIVINIVLLTLALVVAVGRGMQLLG